MRLTTNQAVVRSNRTGRAIQTKKASALRGPFLFEGCAQSSERTTFDKTRPQERFRRGSAATAPRRGDYAPLGEIINRTGRAIYKKSLTHRAGLFCIRWVWSSERTRSTNSDQWRNLDGGACDAARRVATREAAALGSQSATNRSSLDARRPKAVDARRAKTVLRLFESIVPIIDRNHS